MYRSTPTGINFKIFVKETNGEIPLDKVNASRKYLPVAGLTGDKAKEFYEEILKDASLSSGEKKCLPKSKPKVQPSLKPVSNKTFKNADLLWMAQNNDIKNLNVFFNENKNHDVNVVDDFGWTPLMCASCSGAEQAVLLLLENGADPNKRDRLGETALSLARKKNQAKIVQILENLKSKPEIVDDEEETEEFNTFFYCQTCKGNFAVDKNKHESSTVHLFNCRIKVSTFYGIPESNKGFQLLLREGWDKEKGLGRDGTGRKFPIKAVMKKDRKGIGAPTPTHSNKRETQQTENKKRKIYRKWKEKNFEKNFRLEFS